MIEDRFKNTADSLSSPAADCFTITTSDIADMPRASKAIYVGTGGDIVIRAVNSLEDVTLVGVPGGAILPIRIRAVRTTGTTAAALIGLS